MTNPTFRISGTDKQFTYKKKVGMIYTIRLKECIQYINPVHNEIVLYPGFKPRMKHGYIDIIEEKTESLNIPLKKELKE